MERLTLSLDEHEQYNQAYEALRYVLYRQSCQFDRYSPSFERYNQICETAFQRMLLSFELSTLEDLLPLEGAHPVSAASKPPTESVQLAESQSASSSSISVSSDSLSESGDVRDPIYWKCSKERSQALEPADPSSMHSSPTTDGIRCNYDAPISSSEYVKVGVVPGIPSLRRIVRVKGSSMPTIISESFSGPQPVATQTLSPDYSRVSTYLNLLFSIDH